MIGEIRTVQVSSKITAQGIVIQEHPGGVVTIDACGNKHTGKPIEKIHK